MVLRREWAGLAAQGAVVLCLLLAVLILCPAAPAVADEPQPHLWTFAPLFDYRSDPAVDFESLNILGPIIRYDRKGSERDRALRPLFFLATDAERDARQLDVLFPLLTYRSDDESVSYRFLFLFNYYSNKTEAETDQSNASLFPLFYYKSKPGQPTQFAIFPLFGRYENLFGRDKVRYILFPLYAHTERKGTHVDNILWPFFARISGDTPDESGFKVWPLYGHSEKPGVYRKSMTLWPFWISEDLALDTAEPITHRYAFPFYLYSEAPSDSRRTLFWPFFSYHDDRKNGTTEWNFPWPLFAYARGEEKHGYKALPLISDMTIGQSRTRYFLWPLLKISDSQLDTMLQHRTQVLFLLYTDLYEQEEGADREYRHRTLLWPLFGYRQEKGVSHFYSLALLEPLFQQSDGLVRNWSPLWRIYQRKWDEQGNCVSSVLWNLFWHERNPKGVAWELFPLVSYRHEEAESSEWSILKGLISVENDDNARRLHLLYLPWGMRLGDAR